MEVNVNNFKALLLEENEKQNLISRKSGKEELDKHVQDSLAVLPFVGLEGKRIIDIGSGAGFPAMLLAISCPQATFTLVESDLKKSMFLQETATVMGLQNVTVCRERVEELGQDEAYRESFDICTSRAVAATNVMLEYGLPLVKTGGQLLLWKGVHYTQELEEAQNALQVLGAEVQDLFFYTLLEERDRVIVAVKKIAATPKKYPRRTGMPTKRPL